MLLTDEQIFQIRQIIAEYHSAFIVNAISPEAVSKQILEKLNAKGLVDPKVTSLEDSYLYGQALAALDDPKIAKMDYEQFKAYVRKNPIPLSDIEKHAIKMAQHQAAQFVVGLGNKVSTQTGELMIEADTVLRVLMRDEIRTKTAENIAKRESLKKLRSDLGWATKDWSRDWGRIAVTEKNNAMQSGVKDHYAKMYGPDVMVARRPMPDACEHCKRLYLGPDGQPRIFPLSILEANGLTNYGRKVVDWLPVTGSTHPHCQCQTVRVPPGWGFDEDGSLVPGGELGVKYKSEGELKLALWQENDLRKSYKLQGHMSFQGLDIAIENKPGTVRKWKDEQGESGETKMLYAYGYIMNTKGADDDEIDVYVGPDPQAANAYVIHQQNPKTGMYDEDKIMLGFSNERMARAAYYQHYDRPGFLITCTAITMEAFKQWINSTSPMEGEMFKSGTRAIKFVLPLKKGGVQTIGKVPSYIGAAESQAGNRNVVSGSAVNYVFFEPDERESFKPQNYGFDPAPREMVDEAEHARDTIMRDKEIYDFQYPMHNVYPIELPETFKPELDPRDTEKNRESIDREFDAKAAPGNPVEVGETDE